MNSFDLRKFEPEKRIVNEAFALNELIAFQPKPMNRQKK